MGDWSTDDPGSRHLNSAGHMRQPFNPAQTVRTSPCASGKVDKPVHAVQASAGPSGSPPWLSASRPATSSAAGLEAQHASHAPLLALQLYMVVKLSGNNARPE